MDNPFLTAIQGTTATPQVQASSGNPFLDAIKGSSSKTPNPIVNQAPKGATLMTLPNGNQGYKTPSGTTLEVLPNGNRIAHLASQFGGGAYNINPKNPGQVINTGHTNYGGDQAQSGIQRDDIVPVGLGGSNSSPDNIKNTPLGQAQQTDKLETSLAKDVKAGKPLGQARTQIITTKQGGPSQSLWGNFGRALVSQFSPTPSQNMTPSPAGTKAPQNTSSFKPTTLKSVGNFVQSLPQSVAQSAIQPFLKIGTQISQSFGGKGTINPDLIGLKPVQSYSKDVQNAVDQGIPAWEAIATIAAPSIIFDTLYATSPLKETALKISDLAQEDTNIRISKEDVQNIVKGRPDLVDQTKVQAFKQSANDNPNLAKDLRNGYVDIAQKSPTVLSNIFKNAATRPISEIADFGKTFGVDTSAPNIKLISDNLDTSTIEHQKPIETPGKIATVANPIVADNLKTPTLTPKIAPETSLKTEVAPKVESTPNIENQTPSKIAQSIEQKAVEAKLTKGFEGVAGYDKITIKDQAEKATQLMADPEKALSVIRGETPLPEGLRGTALITAAEEHIKSTGDSRLAYELANSPLVSETSAAAQEMRLAAEREPDSITSKFQEIKKAREDLVIKKSGSIAKAKTQIKADIRKEMVNTTPKAKDWTAFLEELKC